MTDSHDLDDFDDECWNCGGEGRMNHCIDGCCVDQDDIYCDFCSKRCDVCNPKRPDPALQEILREALEKSDDFDDGFDAGEWNNIPTPRADGQGRLTMVRAKVPSIRQAKQLARLFAAVDHFVFSSEQFTDATSAAIIRAGWVTECGNGVYPSGSPFTKHTINSAGLAALETYLSLRRRAWEVRHPPPPDLAQ